MKPVLKSILISFAFSAVGMCWLLFMLFRGGGDWLLSWIGVLMAYLSLYTLIDLYCKNTYEKTLNIVLIKSTVTTFSFGVLGIIFGIIHELLTPWSLSLMVWYWLLTLLLFLTTIILLVILVFVNRKDQNFPGVYRLLILLNLLLTLGPVLWPLFLTIIGNGMNASAGW
ncbi:hypothetical protein S3E15_00247 [Bacillus mycoides]|jgi:uncharacterized membrane protein|uniref:DUF3902 family protein n=5 Tax=Bacillus mycoides TaxID=1405 RepID=A0A0B5S8M3_BACMY|nr:MULTISPECIES: DUF3902 family protein [Bacillus]KXY32516.1 hypothetical protein AT269_09770 [Bacillus cereus]AJH18588.1 hypothetical protein BG05_2998 [Bacillus mycoides]EEL98768.1 hypothetical protein bmyco0001_27290 [Bacillus mycoides DSM 2048]EJQ60135.1 hypothetical protein IEW_02766 [Bacillus mycoides]EJQ65706.1 hypothetical protein IEY_02566 [Bacillus mycoides]